MLPILHTSISTDRQLTNTAADCGTFLYDYNVVLNSMLETLVNNFAYAFLSDRR